LEAEKYGLPYAPSPTLIAMIFFAVVGAAAPVQNFNPVGVCMRTDFDPEKPWLLWVTGVTPAEPKVILDPRREATREGRERENLFASVKTEAEKAKHLATVTGLNLEHDAVVLDWPFIGSVPRSMPRWAPKPRWTRELNLTKPPCGCLNAARPFFSNS
jgi:hypothetical protein